jgi:hypothetical protein
MSPTAITVATGSAGDEEGVEAAAGDAGVEDVAAAGIVLWAPLAHPAVKKATATAATRAAVSGGTRSMRWIS